MQIFGWPWAGSLEFRRTRCAHVGREGDAASSECYVRWGDPRSAGKFPGALELGLAERPRELQALRTWQDAFRPTPQRPRATFRC